MAFYDMLGKQTARRAVRGNNKKINRASPAYIRRWAHKQYFYIMTKTTISSGILPAEFEHQMFGQLRVVVTDNQKTMFNLSDVCRALDINNSRQVKSRLAEGGVITADTPTRNQFGTMVIQPMTYIDEANLYRCIFQSRKAEAERFQAWVFEEVLPQIRQTGGYIPLKNLRTGEALTEAEIVDAANKVMQRTIASKNRPADACLTTSDIAKLHGLTTKELNRLLVAKGVQFWNGARFKLTAEYAGSDYGMLRKFCYYALDGAKKERPYLVWTPKGAELIGQLVRGEI